MQALLSCALSVPMFYRYNPDHFSPHKLDPMDQQFANSLFAGLVVRHIRVRVLLIAECEASHSNPVASSLAYLDMYVYMYVTLQECNYALPYVSICRRLPEWLQYAAMAGCINSVITLS